MKPRPDPRRALRWSCTAATALLIAAWLASGKWAATPWASGCGVRREGVSPRRGGKCQLCAKKLMATTFCPWASLASKADQSVKVCFD